MTTQEMNTNITNTNEPAEKKTNKKKAIGIVAVAAVTVAAVIIAMLTACGNKQPTATADEVIGTSVQTVTQVVTDSQGNTHIEEETKVVEVKQTQPAEKSEKATKLMHIMWQRPTTSRTTAVRATITATATAIRLTTIITMPATVRQARTTAHQAAQTSLQAIQAQAVHQVRVNRQAVHQAAQVRASRQAVLVHQASLSRLHSLQQKIQTKARLGTRLNTKPKKFGWLMRKLALGNDQSMRNTRQPSATPAELR